ncbi:hypothetical protein Dform_02095 [Dehalogenimonas formicexedens]|uniref:Fibronectin type-III domain-containing protein n=1 Tax=Dehalogenimonas formicexedens TaxID=1839801 RepID=A0A1P8FAC7_9CHLR|nr:hypothetical protein [Dehalogenimonas formicexedens]APV45404.1 hypothetical protein Dform_02095 [Dehalogenimonas formicexedens]
MKHLNKIFGIVMTAAIAASMLVVSALPVSAADNAWTAVTMPTTTSLTGSGLLTKAIDGTLYAWTNTATANTNSLAKSTDGGRTWTSVKTPGTTAGAAAITAIATSPSEANVLYIATGLSVWKSTDGGATFAALPVGTIAVAGVTSVKSLAVGLLGGSYKVFAGTDGGVYLFDEGVSLNNQFVLFGGLVANVLDVKLSPTFNTAAGIYALTSTGTNASLYVSTGGAFAPTPATIASGAGTTVGEIGFSADFNITSNPVLWVGTDGATGGIFRTTLGGTGFHLGANLPVATIDVTGSGVFGGAVTIVFGTTAGEVYTTFNAGFSFNAAGANLTGGARTAYVALANDYATSGTIFALKAAGAAGDETAFSVSTDKGATFSQISFINSSINEIDSTAFAANGDYYMVTSAAVVTPGAGDAFTLTATAAGTVTLTGAVAAVITTNTSGTSSVAGLTITFGGVGDVATVTATAAGNASWTGAATALETVDTNASMTVGASGVAFAMDMNPVTTSGNHSLWRNVGGKWNRIQGNVAAGMYSMLRVSPNYATDKGVYYVSATNVIMASNDQGITFTAQSFSPGTITTYVVLDNATFVAATSTAGIQRTTNNGFVWNQVSTQNAAFLVRSSDSTALAAVTAAGNVFTSADLGATWKAALSTGLTLANISGVTFQNGSNTVLYAVTNATGTGNIYKLDTAAATVAWGTTDLNTGTAVTNGVGIVSGVAASPVIYALGANGALVRLLTDNSASEDIAAATGVTAASGLFIVPAAGGNTLWAVTATKLYTFKDTIAVAVPNVAVTSFTTTTANVTFGAVAGATDYAAFVKAGTAAQKDYFTATTVGTVTVDKTALTVTVSGLTSDTTYTVSVFAKTPFTSLVGSKTFSTQPNVVTNPVDLAPAMGATGIALTPGFGWGAVTGATSYTVEVSTSSTFATLVGTKQTTTVPAFAWTTPALAYSTTYYWRVVAITPTGSSDPVVSVFTTMAAPVTQPTTPPGTTTITNTTVTLTSPAETTPAYIWAIIGIGALLVIVVIVLIVRTRRVA